MTGPRPQPQCDELDAPLAAWLERELGERPTVLRRLVGGNSNETFLLETDVGRRVLRRPPAATIAPSAHSMEREYRVLSVLADTPVPVPRPLALSTELGAPFLVMEWVDGQAPLERLPDAYATDAHGAGEAIVDVLAELHSQPWRELGLDGFGKPDGFLARQVGRWRSQYERYRVRDLPRFEEVAGWLEAHTPPGGDPGILHGDFHADNCLLARDAPRVAAIVDWEMASIGDPLLDLGLLLAFWGPERADPIGMPKVQAFSRQPGAPSRERLAARYAERSGRSVEHLPYYLALSFWKLAAIVEGAYAHFLAGAQEGDYARALKEDVPALLEEAAAFTRL